MNLYNKTDRLLQIMIFIVVLIVIAFFIFSLEFSHPQDSVKVSPERILRIQTTQPVWLVELRYFWNAYKEFCKTDTLSVEKQYWYYPQSATVDSISLFSITQIPSFEGFMDWIENKYIKPKGE